MIRDWCRLAGTVAMLATGLVAAARAQQVVVDPGRALSLVSRLAADELGGRRTGTPDGDRAAAIVADAFRAAGLEPAGDSGYFQRFAFPFYQVVAPARLDVERDGRWSSLSYGTDFFFITGSGGGSGTAEIVYAGYGLAAPGFDELAAADVAGKIVLAMEGLPPGRGIERRFASNLDKARRARERGARGLLLFPDPAGTETTLSRSRVWALRPQNYLREFVLARLSGAAANALLDGRAAALKRAAADSVRLTASPTGRRLRWEATVVYDSTRRGANVLGLVRGSDPGLAPDVVVVGAHYDGGGRDPDGTPYNGAEDNASGTAAVVEAARVVAAGPRPRRSVLFAGWGAEEQGAWGSQYFLEHGPWPLARIAANVTLDNAGQGAGRFRLFSARNFPEAYALLSASLDRALLDRFTPRGLGGSDGWYFQVRGIPTVFAHADAPQPLVHTPDDDLGTLSPEMLDVVGRFTAQAAVAFANAPPAAFPAGNRLARYIARYGFTATWVEPGPKVPDWEMLRSRGFDLALVAVDAPGDAVRLAATLPAQATVVKATRDLADTEEGAPLRVAFVLRRVPPGALPAEIAAVMSPEGTGGPAYRVVLIPSADGFRSGPVTVTRLGSAWRAQLEALGQGVRSAALVVDADGGPDLFELAGRLVELGVDGDGAESALAEPLRAEWARQLSPPF